MICANLVAVGRLGRTGRNRRKHVLSLSLSDLLSKLGVPPLYRDRDPADHIDVSIPIGFQERMGLLSDKLVSHPQFTERWK